MKVYQTRFEQHNENNTAAIFATLFGCKLEDVEPFDAKWQPPNEYSEHTRSKSDKEFLATYGFGEIVFNYNDSFFAGLSNIIDIPIVISGKSSYNQGKHSVIYKNGQIWHDTYRDGPGLRNMENIVLFVTIGNEQQKKVMQNAFGINNGNCASAAISTLIECPIEDSYKYDAKWQPPNEYNVKIHQMAETEFLRSKGLFGLTLKKDYGIHEHFIEHNPGALVLIVGKSPSGNYNHIVIYKDKKLWHDPHPDGTGLETEEYIMFLVKG